MIGGKMNIWQVFKRSHTIVGLVRYAKEILTLSKRYRRNRIITNYLATADVKKLQLGAGSTFHDDWLCTDIDPQSDRIAFLDATKPFPLNDDVFDYVFSEHMIEHISWHEGLFMLQECKRILKPGGIIRIATPDLERLIGLYNLNDKPLNDKYIKWITDKFLTQVGVYKASFVINNAFRNWGHQFLYDSDLMEMAMQDTGFTNIKRCSPNESENEHLRGIESHGKIVEDEEMALFETMVFEAKCPV